MATLSEIREQANAALSAGEHKRALSLTLLMQRHFPRDYQTLELLGKLRLEGRRLPDSRAAFSQVLEIDPENVLARAALAMIAEEEGDLDEALEQFGRASDVDPGNHEIAAELARLHAQLGHSKPSEPGSSMHATARRFLMENRYENAITWLQEALRQGPDLTDVATGLVRALWLARRPREAEDLAREIVAEHPDSLRALAVIAAATVSRGDSDAVSLLARTSELDPGNAVTRELFAETGMVFPELEEKLDFPDAELQEAIDSIADAASAAEIAQTPSMETAETAANDAEVIAPSEETPEETDEVTPDGEDSAADHLASAGRYAADGEVGLALDEYRAALRLDPSVAGTVGNAALSLVETAPSSTVVHWLAGDAMTMDGQFRKAVEQYQLALKGATETQSPNPDGVR